MDRRKREGACVIVYVLVGGRERLALVLFQSNSLKNR